MQLPPAAGNQTRGYISVSPAAPASGAETEARVRVCSAQIGRCNDMVYDSHRVTSADPLSGSAPSGGHWSCASARQRVPHPPQSAAVTSLIKLAFMCHRGDATRTGNDAL